MDNNIQIFKPELINFSVTVRFACESASQSGAKMISEWVNYFISLRSINPAGKDDYSKCLAVLRHAFFCAGIFAQIEHDNKKEKFIKITLHFENIDNLKKFVDTLEDSIRFA